MYDYISGKCVRVANDCAVVDVSGIGYKVFITQSTSNTLHLRPSTICLFVSFVVREFSHAFYGFLEQAERDLFEMLLNISGIGPKTALAIIGNLPINDLCDALRRKDIQTLCRVPGIGKKTAERLVIELKDLLPYLTTMPSSTKPGQNSIAQDAISALMNLGYHQAIAQKAVKKAVDTNAELADLPSLITLSLKNV